MNNASTIPGAWPAASRQVIFTRRDCHAVALDDDAEGDHEIDGDGRNVTRDAIGLTSPPAPGPPSLASGSARDLFLPLLPFLEHLPPSIFVRLALPGPP